MMIELYNTLTRLTEVFVPLDPNHVTMYVCGPTVYDRPHLGNARSVVVYDILYRLLSHLYPKVTYVRNITDVDDKINQAAKQNQESIRDLTSRIETLFHQDMAELNNHLPTIEPHATDHIQQMVTMIQSLIDNNHAYAAHGHVYFSVKSFSSYGQLSGRSVDELIAGSRVEVSEFKKDAADFVLWKPSASDEPGWDSPWGRGRPGWHIECSVMSTEYLGINFDIHGGGADLQFPHHENEIAQSCCAYPESHFAHYWIHNGFLMVGGEKMSKSLGNFYTVHDILGQGIPGEVIRMVLLSTHYRKPMDWNEKAVSDAQKGLDRFYHVLQQTNTVDCGDEDIAEEVLEALKADLNVPVVIACMHRFAKEGEGKKLLAAGRMIGLLQKKPADWFITQQSSISDQEKNEIDHLVQQRKEAKQTKNWPEADRIRNILTAKKIEVQDHPDGTSSWRKMV
ncbi:MAG: cysteine--tRNA ligase [Alphaproteobacteria bacterium]|nr:cysteine--tRNA ligase [Alphaproteobacteria bacterium]